MQRIAMCVPLNLNAHGGVEKHILCLARALRHRGLQVDLYGRCPAGSCTENFKSLSQFKAVAETYDIIHTQGGFFPPQLLGTIFHRPAGQRLVHTSHNVAFDYMVACKTWLNWRCYTATVCEGFWSRNADHVIAVSQQVRQWAIRVFKVKPLQVTWIPNGSNPVTIDDKVRQDSRRRLGLTDEMVAGIFVGRGYDRVKGTADIVRAFDRLYPRFMQLRLIAIPGCGFMPAPWLIATGDIDHQRIHDYYQAADFFINASFSEGLPLTLIEAMAVGLPVIAAPVGGIPDIIQHQHNGLLIRPDRSDIHLLIEQLATSQPLRNLLAAESLKTAAGLTWDRIAQKTALVYAALR